MLATLEPTKSYWKEVDKRLKKIRDKFANHPKGPRKISK